MKSSVLRVALVLSVPQILSLASSSTAWAEKPAPHVVGVGAGIVVEHATAGWRAGETNGGPVLLGHASGGIGTYEDGSEAKTAIGVSGKAELGFGGHPAIDLNAAGGHSLLNLDKSFGAVNFDVHGMFAGGWTPIKGCGALGEGSLQLRGEGSSFRSTNTDGFGIELGGGLGCLRHDLFVFAGPYAAMTSGSGIDTINYGVHALVNAGPVNVEGKLEYNGFEGSGGAPLVDRRVSVTARTAVGKGVFIGGDFRYADVPGESERNGGYQGQAVIGWASK